MEPLRGSYEVAAALDRRSHHFSDGAERVTVADDTNELATADHRPVFP